MNVTLKHTSTPFYKVHSVDQLVRQSMLFVQWVKHKVKYKVKQLHHIGMSVTDSCQNCDSTGSLMGVTSQDLFDLSS